MSRFILSAAMLLLLASTAVAQVGANPFAGWTAAQKRTWLRSQIAARVADPDALRDAVAKLDRMNDAQLDALLAANQTAVQQAQLAAAQARLAQEVAYRNALLRQYQALQAGRAVGYRPIITTLPQGASLAAGAVVSPDRRYVRINAAPFFSSIGPVRTFNLYNGQTRVYNPQLYRPAYPFPYGGSYGNPYRGSSSNTQGRSPTSNAVQRKGRTW